MNRTRKLLVSTMIAAAGAASALALSGTAAADPVVPAPVNPGTQLLTSLGSMGSAAPQLMQTLASAMSGTAAPAAAPATPPPGATASNATERRRHCRADTLRVDGGLKL